MSTTIYATFTEVENAERAAGALLDYGARPEDISLLKKQGETVEVQTPADSAAFEGSVGAVGSSGIDPSGHSAAAYGDMPTAAGGRFGADATGVTDGTGIHGMTDANGIGGEIEIKRGLVGEPDGYMPGSSRATDDRYDNLASYNEKDENYDPETAAKSGLTATTPADAGAGAVKGAGIGLGIGAVAALVSIIVPGFGPIIGGGALATAIAGAAATTGAGAVAGAVTGYLKDQGMESHVAERYANAVSDGGGLLAVAVPSGTVDESTVRSILDKYGAVNVTDFAGRGSGGYVA